MKCYTHTRYKGCNAAPVRPCESCWALFIEKQLDLDAEVQVHPEYRRNFIYLEKQLKRVGGVIARKLQATEDTFTKASEIAGKW